MRVGAIRAKVTGNEPTSFIALAMPPRIPYCFPLGGFSAPGLESLGAWTMLILGRMAGAEDPVRRRDAGARRGEGDCKPLILDWMLGVAIGFPISRQDQIWRWLLAGCGHRCGRLFVSAMLWRFRLRR